MNKRKITENLTTIIMIYIIISVFSSFCIWMAQAGKEGLMVRGETTIIVGCDVDSPWTRIFYSKLFCQIKGRNR